MQIAIMFSIILAMPILSERFWKAEICYDIDSSLQILVDELDIGSRSGLVYADFATKYSKLLSNMGERIEEQCNRHKIEYRT